MKRFTIPCDFSGQKAPFHIYVGVPRKDNHPLHNQKIWLSNERGGVIPQDVMESFGKLHEIAIRDNVNLENLCVYALRKQEAAAGDEAALRELQEKDKSSLGKYIIGPGWLPYEKAKHSDSDNILEDSQDKTAIRAMKLAQELWPGSDDLSRSARILFLGLALYIGATPDKSLTLSEIFRSITADDVPYSICVILDTAGALLSPLCYRLLIQWLNNHSDYRQEILTHMTSTMTEFALFPSKKTDKFHSMRMGLQKSLFHI